VDLLLINGASGSGKTTLAKALSEVLEGWYWAHPDGLLPDTPHMGAEEILEKSLSWVDANVREHRVLIDCQIRPTSIPHIVRDHSIDSCEVILLTCPRATREQRLLERGWSNEDFEQVESWSRILRNESDAAGLLILDTAAHSVEYCCRKLQSRGITSP